MQTDRQAQGQAGGLILFRTLLRPRRHLYAMLTAALFVAATFAQATAQGVYRLPGSAAQSAAAPIASPPAQSPKTTTTQPLVPAAQQSSAPLGAAVSADPAVITATPNPKAGPGTQASNPVSAAPTLPLGEPSIGGDMLPQQLSFERMFLDADRVVKAVMIGLALASIVTWTILLAKTLELGKARREIRRGLRVLVNAATLAQAHDQLRNVSTAAAQLMQAAAQEIRLSAGAQGDGLKERIALQLDRLEMAISRKIGRGTGVLATIGSTAVFVGLFGTVWGIMNSFIGISNAHTTNLAVVAPGIAQALLATAMGLIAAIPAVVIYNVLTRQTAHYRALLGDASAQIIRLVSRDLDRARLPLAQAAE
ncbi:MAG: tonB-system energizer ExbB [Xanthobacteraceae bacterium]